MNKTEGNQKENGSPVEVMLSERDVMSLLGIRRRELYRLGHEGKLPAAFRVETRHVTYLYRVTDLAAYAKGMGVVFDKVEPAKGVSDVE